MKLSTTGTTNRTTPELEIHQIISSSKHVIRPVFCALAARMPKSRSGNAFPKDSKVKLFQLAFQFCSCAIKGAERDSSSGVVRFSETSDIRVLIVVVLFNDNTSFTSFIIS